MNKISLWSNRDNQKFYNSLTVQDFQNFADSAGLTEYPDLLMLNQILENACAVLEIGAGYGRVIDYLLKINNIKNIIAVENSTLYFEALMKKYSNNSLCDLYNNVAEDINILKGSNFRNDAKNINIEPAIPPLTLIQSDISLLSIETKPDLILWLWSGIADFNPKEQLNILKNLKNILSRNGVLVIDTISADRIPVGMKQIEQQTYIQQYKDSKICTYSLSNEELDAYASKLDFDITHTEYLTSSNRKRLLHIFRK